MSLTNLVAQLQDKKPSPESILIQLQSLRDACISTNPSPNIITTTTTITIQQYRNICKILFNHIYRDWIGCFSTLEIQQSFDIFFHPKHIPSFLALDGLITTIISQSKQMKEQKHNTTITLDIDIDIDTKGKNKATQRIPSTPTSSIEQHQLAEKCTSLLYILIIEHNAIGNTLNHFLYNNNTNTISFLRNILKIPDLLFAILKKNTPVWLTNTQWYTRMSQQLTSICITKWLTKTTKEAIGSDEEKADDDEEEEEEEVIQTLALTTTTLVRIGSIRQLSISWCKMILQLKHAFVNESEFVKSKILQRHGRLLRALPIDVVETLLTCCLKNNEEKGNQTEIEKSKRIIAVWFANAVHSYIKVQKVKANANEYGSIVLQRNAPLYAVFTRRLLFHYEFINIIPIFDTLDEVTSRWWRRKRKKNTSISNRKKAIENQKKEQNFILTSLAGIWSDSEFVMSTNWSRHQYVSQLLMMLLQRWMVVEKEQDKNDKNNKHDEENEKDKKDENVGNVENVENHLMHHLIPCSIRLEESGALNYLMSGVQHHLEHGVVRVRRIGMRVAQVFSHILDPKAPLLFQEIQKEDEDAKKEKEKKQEKEKQEKEKQEKQETAKKHKAQKESTNKDTDALSTSTAATMQLTALPIAPATNPVNLLPIDPDELVTYGASTTNPLFSSDEDDDDNSSVSSDSDDEFVPYDMDEDESSNTTTGIDGKNTARVPVYARDLLRLMEQSQKEGGRECYDAYDMWKKTVLSVVSRMTSDVLVHAIQLVSGLMAMENKYGDESFNSIRHEAIIHLLISTTNIHHNQKTIALDYLISKFYTPNYGLAYRSNILIIVQDVCVKLSNLNETEEIKNTNKNNGSKNNGNKIENDDVKNLLLPLQYPCGTVIKRFTKSQKEIVVTNRFSEISNRVFYPLISKYDQKTNDLDLIGRDCLLLVELIRTLSIVLECTMSLRHEVIGMSGVLLEVVCALRMHENVTVRRSLMYAISRILLIDVKMMEESGGGKKKTSLGMRSSTMYEIYEWLKVVSKKDGDTVCRQQAGVLISSGWFN